MRINLFNSQIKIFTERKTSIAAYTFTTSARAAKHMEGCTQAQYSISYQILTKRNNKKTQ